MIALAVYVSVGLSVFAMCFNLMEEEVIQKLKRLGRFIGIVQDRTEKNSSSVETLQSDAAGKVLWPQRTASPRSSLYPSFLPHSFYLYGIISSTELANIIRSSSFFSLGYHTSFNQSIVLIFSSGLKN